MERVRLLVLTGVMLALRVLALLPVLLFPLTMLTALLPLALALLRALLEVLLVLLHTLRLLAVTLRRRDPRVPRVEFRLLAVDR